MFTGLRSKDAEPTIMPKRNTHTSEQHTLYEQTFARAIGARIRTRRRELQLTQRSVRLQAEAANVLITRTQFSRFEQGESDLNATEIIAFAAILDVSYQWLLDGDA